MTIKAFCCWISQVDEDGNVQGSATSRGRFGSTRSSALGIVPVNGSESSSKSPSNHRKAALVNARFSRGTAAELEASVQDGVSFLLKSSQSNGGARQPPPQCDVSATLARPSDQPYTMQMCYPLQHASLGDALASVGAPSSVPSPGTTMLSARRASSLMSSSMHSLQPLSNHLDDPEGAYTGTLLPQASSPRFSAHPAAAAEGGSAHGGGSYHQYARGGGRAGQVASADATSFGHRLIAVHDMLTSSRGGGPGEGAGTMHGASGGLLSGEGYHPHQHHQHGLPPQPPEFLGPQRIGSMGHVSSASRSTAMSHVHTSATTATSATTTIDDSAFQAIKGSRPGSGGMEGAGWGGAALAGEWATTNTSTASTATTAATAARDCPALLLGSLAAASARAAGMAGLAAGMHAGAAGMAGPGSATAMAIPVPVPGSPRRAIATAGPSSFSSAAIAIPVAGTNNNDLDMNPFARLSLLSSGIGPGSPPAALTRRTSLGNIHADTYSSSAPVRGEGAVLMQRRLSRAASLRQAAEAEGLDTASAEQHGAARVAMEIALEVAAELGELTSPHAHAHTHCPSGPSSPAAAAAAAAPAPAALFGRDSAGRFMRDSAPVARDSAPFERELLAMAVGTAAATTSTATTTSGTANNSSGALNTSAFAMPSFNLFANGNANAGSFTLHVGTVGEGSDPAPVAAAAGVPPPPQRRLLLLPELLLPPPGSVTTTGAAGSAASPAATAALDLGGPPTPNASSGITSPRLLLHRPAPLDLSTLGAAAAPAPASHPAAAAASCGGAAGAPGARSPDAAGAAVGAAGRAALRFTSCASSPSLLQHQAATGGSGGSSPCGAAAAGHQHHQQPWLAPSDDAGSISPVGRSSASRQAAAQAAALATAGSNGGASSVSNRGRLLSPRHSRDADELTALSFFGRRAQGSGAGAAPTSAEAPRSPTLQQQSQRQQQKQQKQKPRVTRSVSWAAITPADGQQRQQPADSRQQQDHQLQPQGGLLAFFSGRKASGSGAAAAVATAAAAVPATSAPQVSQLSSPFSTRPSSRRSSTISMSDINAANASTGSTGRAAGSARSAAAAAAAASGSMLAAAVAAANLAGGHQQRRQQQQQPAEELPLWDPMLDEFDESLEDDMEGEEGPQPSYSHQRHWRQRQQQAQAQHAAAAARNPVHPSPNGSPRLPAHSLAMQSPQHHHHFQHHAPPVVPSGHALPMHMPSALGSSPPVAMLSRSLGQMGSSGYVPALTRVPEGPGSNSGAHSGSYSGDASQRVTGSGHGDEAMQGQRWSLSEGEVVG